MGSYDVSIDRSANRLYLTLEGHMDASETGNAADETIAAIDKLRPGWEMINDISSFKPATQDATEHIERGKQYAAENDVAAVVRVVDDVTGKMQFDRVGKDVETYEVATAGSVSEAEEMLDER